MAKTILNTETKKPLKKWNNKFAQKYKYFSKKKKNNNEIKLVELVESKEITDISIKKEKKIIDDPPVIILEENNKIIDKWFHISDIHIPEKKGFDDYKILFNRLFKKIRKYGKPYENTIIIVTGNILDKGAFSMDPKTHELCCYFYEGMLNYCTVFTIHGNRDFYGSNRYENSNPLEYIIGTNFSKNLKNRSYVLYDNSNYVYNDIVLCPTQYNSPKLTKCMVKKKFSIGLYNGQIYDSTLKNKLSGSFTVQDFEKNYDSTHLGYMHKRQNLSKIGNVWYSGSLKQLNADDEIEKGIILFSSKGEKNQFIRIIDNSVNYYTIDKINDLDNINFNVDNIVLTISRNDIDIVFDKLEIMERYNCEIEIKIKPEKISQRKLNLDMNINGKKFEIDIKNKEDIIDIALDYAKNNIKDSDGNLLTGKTLEDIKNKIIEKSQHLIYESSHIGKNISIKSLKFDNILIYGEGNEIDFTKMKGVVSLQGKNGIGKSSLIDSIFVAIYGICPKGIYKTIVKKGSVKKMSKKKNEEAGCFKSCIEFSVNNINYIIERKYESNGNSQTNNCSIFFYEKDTSKVILKSSSKNDWKVGETTIGKKNIGMFDELIKKYLCSYEDFKLNFVMLQKTNEIGFVNMSETERNNLLLKVFKIDIFNDIAENIKKWKDKLSLNKKNNTELFMKDGIIFDKLKKNDRISEIKNTIENEYVILENLKKDKNKLDKKKKDIDKKINKYDKNNEYYNSYISKYGTIEDIKDNYNKKIEIDKKLLEIENILQNENKKLKNTKREIRDIKKLILKHNTKKKNIEEDNKKLLNILGQNEIKKSELEHKYIKINENIKTADFYEKIIDKLQNKKNDIDKKYYKLINNYDNGKLTQDDLIKELKKIVTLSNEDVGEELIAKNNIDLCHLQEKNILDNNKNKNKINNIEKKINSDKKKIEENEKILAQIEVTDKEYNCMEEEIKLLSNNIIHNSTIKEKYTAELNIINLKILDLEKIGKCEKIEEYKKFKKSQSELVVEYETILKNITTNENKLEKLNMYYGEFIKINEESELCDLITQIFSNKTGITGYFINNRIIPFIENITNEVLHTTGFKYTIRLVSENNKIELFLNKTTDNNNEVQVKLNSGFEIEMINIIMTFVLTQINTKLQSNFMVIDEPFSKADYQHVDNMVKMLVYWRKMFEFIIIISHNDDIINEADQKIHIQEINNYTSKVVFA